MPVLGTTTEAHTTTNATSLSFSFTSDGSPLLVRVNLRGQSSSPSSVSVTFNGVSVPLVTNATALNASSRTYAGIFYLATPDSTTANIVVSWTNSSACVAGASHVTEGDTPTNGNGNTGATTTATVDITSTVGDLVVDATNVSSSLNLTSNTTQDFAGTSTGAATNIDGHGSHADAVGTTTTMSYGISSSANWAIAGCSIPTKIASSSQPAMILGI